MYSSFYVLDTLLDTRNQMQFDFKEEAVWLVAEGG